MSLKWWNVFCCLHEWKEEFTIQSKGFRCVKCGKFIETIPKNGVGYIKEREEKKVDTRGNALENDFGMGDLLKDKVTGYEGVVMGITLYFTGCVHYGLSSRKVKEDGTINSWEWFDSTRLDLVKEKQVEFRLFEKPTSGNFPNPPQF